MARRLEELIPENTWLGKALRTTEGNMATSGLGQLVESLASSTPTGRVLGDLGSDILKESFSGHDRPSGPEVKQAAEHWAARWPAYAQEEIQKGKSATEVAEIEALLDSKREAMKRQFEMAHREMHAMDQKEAGLPASPAPPINWSNRVAAYIQERCPRTRPPAVADATAGGLPPIRLKYGRGARQEEAELGSTLVRGTEAGVHGFGRFIVAAVVIVLVIAAWIGFSLLWGSSSGLVLSGVLFVLAIALVVIRHPLISSAVGLAWWKWGPGGPIRFILGFVGTLFALAIVFLWWPDSWDVRWRHTIVLGVAVVALFFGAGGGKLFKKDSAHGEEGHGGRRVGVGTVLAWIVLVALVYIYLPIDIPAAGSPPPAPASQPEASAGYTVVGGHDWTMTSTDVLVTVPAGTTEWSCIKRPRGLRHFKVGEPNGDLEFSPNCTGRRRAWADFQFSNENWMLAGIGVRNPAGRKVQFYTAASP